jgi:hypothetical protein
LILHSAEVVCGSRGFILCLAASLRHFVDINDQCQNHDIVLARINFNTIAVLSAELLVAYFGYPVAAFTDSELVVNDAIRHIQVTADG